MPQGPDYLRHKLAVKSQRVNIRYKYYEMKNAVRDFNITIPREWTWLTATLGWSAKAVDALADRLVFHQFENDNFQLNKIFDMNSRDVLIDSAILSACISSCCFVYISADEDGYPRLQVIDGGNATGIIDPITMLLKEGYAVLERDPKNGSPILEAYFLPGETVYYDKSENMEYSITNPAEYPLLVPIIHRPDARRPFGHSRITRACIGVQQAALRTMKRAEVAAEFYSVPQKWISGLSQDADQFEKWEATIASLLQIDQDENGQAPKLGQFSQQTMQPFIDQLRMYASLFAGETGLTLDDLGFVAENPSSADAIKASHENLRLTARKAQRTFGVGFLNVGYLAACLRDDFPYRRNQFYLTEPSWDPIFEPDASQISGIGDAVIKIQQSFPDYFSERQLRELTGI